MSEFDEARTSRSYWIEVILLSVGSAMGYLVPLIGPLLFLVPLQVLLVRRGITAFGYGAALFGLAAVSFRLLSGWGFELSDKISSSLMRAEILQLSLLVVGLYVLASERFRRYRVIYRLIGATFAVGIITAPLMDSFMETFSQAAESLLVNFALSESTSMVDGVFAEPMVGAQAVASWTTALTSGVLRSYLLIYFVFLASQWWIGTAVGARSARMPSPLQPLTRFHAPEQLVWVLAGGLIIIALDMTKMLDQMGLEILAAFGWNAALVIAFVFGVQGVSIIRMLADRQGLSKMTSGLLIGVILIIGLFAMTWLLFIICALGVSEIWVHYRRRLSAGGSEPEDDVEPR